MKRIFRRHTLDEALFLAGMVSHPANAYQWLLLKEKKGFLVSPRDPVTGQRKFTEKQIKEIVKAFMPSGKGEWKYEG